MIKDNQIENSGDDGIEIRLARTTRAKIVDNSIRNTRNEHGIEVSLTDYDVDRFDPRDVKSIDTDVPLELRSAEGLGLYLVLKMADSIHYEYRNRTSKITFIADRK